MRAVPSTFLWGHFICVGNQIMIRVSMLKSDKEIQYIDELAEDIEQLSVSL